jgi:hypothetical protein
MFANFDYLFEMHTMKRFDDLTLISILDKMRRPGGTKLSDAEWDALQGTAVDETELESNPDAFEAATSGWFESSYLWARVTMISYMRATMSARQHKQILFYSQAVDKSDQIPPGRPCKDIYYRMLAEPSLARTGRLPGCALFHQDMRVRLTTQVLPPWAVQDATGTIMQIELSARDRRQMKEIMEADDDGLVDSEVCLHELPAGVYVKLDKCDHEFLPPQVCKEHRLAGFYSKCSECRAFAGWVLVEPICRTWTYKDAVTGGTFSVKRSQLPIMPEAACSLYALQGATTDPGLVAHFVMPRRADADIKWLIVYVLLSRVRSLSRLKCVGLTNKIREIIESGAPALLVENFEKLFRSKIGRTLQAAKEAKAALGWD